MKKQGWGRIVNMASAHAPVHRDCGVDHRRLITDRGRLDRALTGTGGPPTKYEPCYIMTIEVIMQEFNCNVIKRPQWTHAMALERRLGLPRGMLLSRAPDAQTPVTRVLALSRLDGVMLRHFTHMLRVTVKDWMASIA